MIEIGKIGSLNIYFSGEVFEPGIHLIHPFSDVFMSLSKAGEIGWFIKKGRNFKRRRVVRYY